jgi:Ca2+-transporting ATPase
MESMNYHNMSKAQIYRLLDTCENGLSENEAAKRLKKYGLNQLSSPKKKNILLRFLMQFNDFMTLILIGSAIISLVISFLNDETDFIEPIIIMSIVCLNGFIGVVQESKAEAAIESLKKMSALSANVLRNKQRKKIPASQLVPGDIIYLETGDMIPADCYILNSTYLTSDESSLTGESIP